MATVAATPVSRRRVEHVDIDSYGVVHFARYATFAETAMLELLEAHGAGLVALARRGLELRVREVRLSYAAPARLSDDLRLDATVDRAGAAGFRVVVTIVRTDGIDVQELVSVNLDLVLVEITSSQPVLIPEDIRCLLTNDNRQ